MKNFKDNQGREWQLAINIAAIKRVRSLLDVDLLDLNDGKILERLSTDPILLCDVLFCLIQPQAETKNISDEDFGASLAGDAIEHATTALLEELADFFPNRKRELLKKALQKMNQLESKALQVAAGKLDDPALEKEIEAILNQSTSGN